MIERAFVTLAEGQVHLRRVVRGGPGVAGGTRPLLLFHASPSSSWGLQGLMRALVDAGVRGDIVAPDTLGNGDSAAPASEHPDIAYFADSMRRAGRTVQLFPQEPYDAWRGNARDIAGRLVQQFAYHKLVTELRKRHYDVVEESVQHDQSIGQREELFEVGGNQ